MENQCWWNNSLWLNEIVCFGSCVKFENSLYSIVNSKYKWIIVFFFKVYLFDSHAFLDQSKNIAMTPIYDCLTCSKWHHRGHHGCDRMVVGFTTTCAISTYHHLKLWVRTPSHVIKFLQVLRFPPPIKLTAKI